MTEQRPPAGAVPHEMLEIALACFDKAYAAALSAGAVLDERAAYLANYANLYDGGSPEWAFLDAQAKLARETTSIIAAATNGYRSEMSRLFRRLMDDPPRSGKKAIIEVGSVGRQRLARVVRFFDDGLADIESALKLLHQTNRDLDALGLGQGETLADVSGVLDVAAKEHIRRIAGTLAYLRAVAKDNGSPIARRFTIEPRKKPPGENSVQHEMLESAADSFNRLFGAAETALVTLDKLAACAGLDRETDAAQAKLASEVNDAVGRATGEYFDAIIKRSFGRLVDMDAAGRRSRANGDGEDKEGAPDDDRPAARF